METGWGCVFFVCVCFHIKALLESPTSYLFFKSVKLKLIRIGLVFLVLQNIALLEDLCADLIHVESDLVSDPSGGDQIQVMRRQLVLIFT